MNKNNTKKTTSGSSFPCAIAVLTLLVFTNATQAADNRIDIPRNPLIAGFNVDPNVLIAFDDSGSMIFEVLFKSQGSLHWKSDVRLDVDYDCNYVFGNNCIGRHIDYEESSISGTGSFFIKEN